MSSVIGNLPADAMRPPHSAEAERAVLGAILRSSEHLTFVAGMLRPEHFFLDSHQKIYSVMIALFDESQPADVITVADRLRQMESDRDLLGPAYLVELTENSPVTQNIEHYAEIVRRYYYLRTIILRCQEVVRKAYVADGRVEDFIEDIERDFLSIANDQDRKGLVTIQDVLEETLIELEERLKNDGKVTGVESGFVDMDKLTGGWQKSDLIILAARPAMGKTALGMNFAINAVKAGKPTAFFTLEMSKSQLMMRVLASEGRIDSSRLRKGDLTEDERDRLIHTSREMTRNPAMLGIDETPGLTLTELRSRSRRFKLEHGLGLIVIDYLQLMGSSASRRYESREREISEISMGLKALAKELEVPVIALAQLNRGPDSRPDKRPRLSDLRESGSMEQDADLIMFVYRDEYYNQASEDRGKAEIIMGKNRHGPVETVMLAYQPNFVSFHNLLPGS